MEICVFVHSGGQADWMFGVLNTFGNVERLHGDVSDLIARVRRVVADPKAALAMPLGTFTIA